MTSLDFKHMTSCKHRNYCARRILLTLSELAKWAAADIYSEVGETLFENREFSGLYDPRKISSKVSEVVRGDSGSGEVLSSRVTGTLSESKYLVNWHSHPNDYNEMLFNEGRSADLPSGTDIAVDLLPQSKGPDSVDEHRLSTSAILVASKRNSQVAVTVYRWRNNAKTQILTMGLQLGVDMYTLSQIISGYFQVVKIIFINFMTSVEESVRFFVILDSDELNRELDRVRKEYFKDKDEYFHEMFHGPNNVAMGTDHWPFKGAPFICAGLDIAFAVSEVKLGKLNSNGSNEEAA